MSVAKGIAERILATVPSDRAFYFYMAMDAPTGSQAQNLKEFGLRIKTIDAKSLEFHLERGDFERWVYMLGDGELVKSLTKLRDSKTSGEKLRTDLLRIVQTRVRQLQKATAKK